MTQASRGQCRMGAGWILGGTLEKSDEGFSFFFFSRRDCLRGKEGGVRQITNSAEGRKTVAEGGIHSLYISLTQVCVSLFIPKTLPQHYCAHALAFLKYTHENLVATFS